MTLLEAFACGTPVIGSDLGGIQEIVKDRRNGLHFSAGDACDLASKIEWALGHPAELAVMGHGARHDFEQLYTAEANYKLLLQIYDQAIIHAYRN